MMKRIKPMLGLGIVVPTAWLIKNKLSKGKPDHSLPQKKRVVVVGGGVNGIVSSYFLTRDP
jgi:hypothetical protein